MKKGIKNALSFIISLLTMFAILVASISLFLDKIVLNEHTYIKILQKENITKQVESYIYENLDYLLITNNIPTGTLDNIISEEEIEDTLYNYINFTVEFMKSRSGEIEPLNLEVYGDRFDNKIDDFIKKNEKNINDDFYGNLGDFKTSVLNIIKSSLQVIDLNALSKSPAIKLVAKASSIISGIKFFGLLSLIIIMLNLSHFIIWKGRRKSRGFAWLSYSFVSAGMILFLIGFSGYLSKFYKNIAIGIEHLKNTTIAIMESYLLNVTYLGVMILALGIVFMCVYWQHLFRVYRCKVKS